MYLYYPKNFSDINSFNTHPSITNKKLGLRLDVGPKVTQLMNGGTRIQIQSSSPENLQMKLTCRNKRTSCTYKDTHHFRYAHKIYVLTCSGANKQTHIQTCLIYRHSRVYTYLYNLGMIGTFIHLPQIIHTT